MAKTKKSKVRLMYVTDAHSENGAHLAEVYWRRGGLAVTRLPTLNWAVTIENNGYAAGPSRWENPKDAVRAAQALLPLTDWKTRTFDWFHTHSETMKPRVVRALKRAGVIK
jgi:hypothetical protein